MILALGSAALAGAPNGPDQSPGHQPKAAHGQSASDHTTAPTSSAETVPQPNEQRGRENSRPGEQAAEHPQHDPIRWTDVLVALSAFVSAIFAGVLAWFTCRLMVVGHHQHLAMLRSNVVSRRAIRAAQEANALGREALVVDQRPWLVPDSNITSGLRWTKTEGRIDFRFVIKNLGKTPARYALVDARLHWKDDVRPEDTYLALSKQMRDRPLNDGVTIFPGFPFTQDIALGMPIEDIRAYYANTRPAGAQPQVSPYLIGCVDYLDLFSDTHHQTGFVFQIDRKLTIANTMAIGPDHGDIPPAELEFFAALGGFVAD